MVRNLDETVRYSFQSAEHMCRYTSKIKYIQEIKGHTELFNTQILLKINDPE